jgi:hypothetical protein
LCRTRRHQTSSRAAMLTTQSTRRPALTRDIQQLDNAVRRVLETPSFTRASDRSRRAAGRVRRKAIPQPAVRPNADDKPAPTAISEAGGARAWGLVGQAAHVLVPLAFGDSRGDVTDSSGDIIDVGFPQPRGVVAAGGGQGCARRGLKTTELTLLAQDRPACTTTVNSRAEVCTRCSREPRPRLLVRPVPFNPLDKSRGTKAPTWRRFLRRSAPPDRVSFRVRCGSHGSAGASRKSAKLP